MDPNQFAKINFNTIKDPNTVFNKQNVEPIKSNSSTTKIATNTNTTANTSPCVTEENNLTYTATQIIGSGSFGVVYQAIIAETGEVVAIKKVFQDRRYKNRELEIIKELDHPNVVKLRHAFYTQGDKPDEVYLNAVMDYVPDTLGRLSRQYFKSKTQMPLILVKVYAFQMMKALAYLHGIGICHRDIKPQNILVNPADYTLKLCDFGSAKKLVIGEPNVAYICSRYYRAPELIFGATGYTNQVDVWSMGCVIAELVLGRPLFPGESAVDQLVEIIKVLGSPTKQQILVMNPDYHEYKIPQIKPYPWIKVFKNKNYDEYFIDFISKVLVYEPNIRFTPLQALTHPFFDEIKDPSTVLPDGKPVCRDLFNFSNEELKSDPKSVEKLLESLTYKK